MDREGSQKYPPLPEETWIIDGCLREGESVFFSDVTLGSWHAPINGPRHISAVLIGLNKMQKQKI